MAWEIKIGAGARATPKTYGIETVAIECVSLAPDVATLSGTSATLAAEYADQVEIWHGGVRRFLGHVRTVPLLGAYDRTLRAEGVFGALSRVVFCQNWTFPVGGGFEQKPSTRVILGQDEDGNPLTVAAQIAAIVAYAASRGVAIQLGTCNIPLLLPMDEVRDLTCAQAIARMLRLSPSICSWVDYTTTPPTIHFGQAAAISPARMQDSVVTMRHDLAISGLRLEIERSHDINGKSYRTLEVLTAGNWEDVNACWASLQLAGQQTTRNIVEVQVSTEDIPESLSASSWWCARHPRLAGTDPTDVAITYTERGASPASYPRISLTPLQSLASISVSARVETFYALADVVKRDAEDEIISVERAVELEMQLVTTNATTRTYKYLQSFSSASSEPTPDGLAAALYAHWSILYAEGSAQWPLADLWAHPGMLLHATPIQRTVINSADAVCNVIYGPAQQLSASDLAGLLSRFRSRRTSVRYTARTTGETAAPAVDTRATTAIVRTAGHAPGALRRTKVVDTVGELTHAIDLHPGCIAFADEEHEAAQILQPRELRVVTEVDGIQQAMLSQILASEPYGDDPLIKYLVEAGVQEHDYSALENRDWNATMPGIAFKHPGGATSGLRANIESGTDAGPRLDMGWGGAGGGNFELYAKTHSTRPGEFRIIYGGGDYGRIIFTRYNGTNWKVVGGFSKEGRFIAGLTDAVFPGVSGSDAGGTLTAPAHPFQVYNEGTTLRGAIRADGTLYLSRDTTASAPADASLANSSFALYQDGADVKLKIKDASGTVQTITLGEGGTEIPDGTDTGQILIWDTTNSAWKVSAVGTLATGDVLVWDGSKFVRTSPASLVKYNTSTKSLQVLVGSSWKTITGGQAVPLP